MYFVRFEKAGQVRLGLADVDRQGRCRRVLDLEAARLRWGGPPVPADMVAWIALGPAGIEAARRWWQMARETSPHGTPDPLTAALQDGQGESAGGPGSPEDREPAGDPGAPRAHDGTVMPLWHAAAEVRLLAPIGRPPKNVIAVGLNYREHVLEWSGREVPDHPVIFTKAASAIVGPGDPIETHPDVTSAVDYEGELAVIIGRRGRRISRQEARDYVYGYTILNDVTARDLQRRTSQWHLGKSLDTFCPIGPYLVHRDAIPWPLELELRTWVNGQLRQRANTRQLIFDIPTLIERLSSGMTLEPGDIIATGTPSGVGTALEPPRFLRPGDVVEVEIEFLGKLRNPVR